MQHLYLAQLERYQEHFKLLCDTPIFQNYGILNKGNNSYINTVLQCLITMVQFWSSFVAVFNKLPPLGSSFENDLNLLQTFLSF